MFRLTISKPFTISRASTTKASGQRTSQMQPVETEPHARAIAPGGLERVRKSAWAWVRPASR